MPVSQLRIVFISSSHDSEAHRDRVLALSERLRQDGFETQLDRYVQGSPTHGWPRWMLDQLDEAAFDNVLGAIISGILRDSAVRGLL